MKIPVVISTDCALDAWWHDPDDALALLYLLTNKKIEVKAILTTFGNTSESQVFSSVQQVMVAVSSRLPIIRGAQHKNDSCLAMSAFINGYKDAHSSVLISLGPLTNL